MKEQEQEQEKELAKIPTLFIKESKVIEAFKLKEFLDLQAKYLLIDLIPSAKTSQEIKILYSWARHLKKVSSPYAITKGVLGCTLWKEDKTEIDKAQYKKPS